LRDILDNGLNPEHTHAPPPPFQLRDHNPVALEPPSRNVDVVPLPALLLQTERLLSTEHDSDPLPR
jgi:hypothetical protein